MSVLIQVCLFALPPQIAYLVLPPVFILCLRTQLLILEFLRASFCCWFNFTTCCSSDHSSDSDLEKRDNNFDFARHVSIYQQSSSVEGGRYNVNFNLC